MFNWTKKVPVNIEDVLDTIATAPQVPLSDAMVKRDNFFHSCWMMLKNERPDLHSDMTRVELILSGYNPDGEEKKDETDEDTKEGIRL